MTEIIVINDGRNDARLEFMTTQLGKFGTDFLRQNAVAPDSLPDDPTPDYWDGWTRGITPDEKARFWSHRKAWEWIAKNGAALVLDDTMLISRDATQIASNVEGTAIIEHLTFEVHTQAKILDVSAIPIANGVAAQRLYLDRSGVAGAYVLSARGAKKLLERTETAGRPVDQVLRHADDLLSYQSVPAQAVRADLAAAHGLDAPDVAVDPASVPRTARNLRQRLRGVLLWVTEARLRARRFTVAESKIVKLRPEAFD